VTDWGQLYRDHVTLIGALAGDLSDEQLATTVPATPAWTVHQVLAHLAGGAADSLSGRTDGAPGPEWTARHVAERAGRPVAELVAELRSNADAVADSTTDSPRPAIVWDVAVHHADLHEALGTHRLPDHLWTPVVEMVGPWRAPDLVATVEPYELFRGLFSRRSRAQMRAWGLADEAVDEVCIFGPREDDQPLPA
jgi:uncharacterized protein (TIGR03083 family)